MNWKQIYTSATPEERLDLLLAMLQAVETRQARIVFTGQRLLRDRRRGYRAHFLNNRRGQYSLTRFVSLGAFAVTLLTVSAVTGIIVPATPPHVGGPVLFFYTTSLLAVLAFRPTPNRLASIWLAPRN